MQAQEQRKPPTAVVFDSSIDEDIAQILALALLLGAESRREIRLSSLSVSRNNLKIATFCDLMARFFGVSPSIGMATSVAAKTDVPPMLQAVLDKPVYNRTLARLNDTADPVALIRNALTAQQDQNTTVVLSGPPANLLGVLALPGSKQLIQKKVRSLIVAAPFGDASGHSKLLAEWPGPVILAPEDLGKALSFPADSVEKDFAYATNHPLVDAYRAAKPMPYDAPAASLAAVLHATKPGENYFQISEGKQRQLLADPAKKDQIIQAYRQGVSAKPPEPRRGARGA